VLNRCAHCADRIQRNEAHGAQLTAGSTGGNDCCVSENKVAVTATYQSAERALALLSSFEDGRIELGVTEMAASLRVHKSTASRLATALERAGFLTRHGRRYRLGAEVIRLGTLALQSFDLVEAMRPAMEKLSQHTGETVNLAVPDGAEVLNVAEVPSTYILSSSGGWIGRRTKAHAVANGKVLLAYGALAMPRVLDRYTDHTIRNAGALAAELAAVRRDGYATAVGELEDGLAAVAAPVFDPAGTCVAALSISGPAFRMPLDVLDELGALCAATAGARSA
jgi:IclR family transcriptional regulator, acetate operon repressor